MSVYNPSRDATQPRVFTIEGENRALLLLQHYQRSRGLVIPALPSSTPDATSRVGGLQKEDSKAAASTSQDSKNEDDPEEGQQGLDGNGAGDIDTEGPGDGHGAGVGDVSAQTNRIAIRSAATKVVVELARSCGDLMLKGMLEEVEAYNSGTAVKTDGEDLASHRVMRGTLKRVHRLLEEEEDYHSLATGRFVRKRQRFLDSEE